jgi:ABC-type molybdate transport system substrate-binding protein
MHRPRQWLWRDGNISVTIKVLSTHAVQEVLSELSPVFKRASGVDLAIGYDPANALKRTIEAGTPFDVAIVTRTVIDELVMKARFAARPAKISVGPALASGCSRTGHRDC